MGDARIYIYVRAQCSGFALALVTGRCLVRELSWSRNGWSKKCSCTKAKVTNVARYLHSAEHFYFLAITQMMRNFTVGPKELKLYFLTKSFIEC